MKNNSRKSWVYAVIGIIVLGIAYTACKDITPQPQRVETGVELKLSK